MRDYLSEMLNALTSAYSRNDYDNRQRGSPVETNIGKLFSVLAWGLDSVQEQAELIKLWDNIDYARGSVLDRYGANFGVKRNGASDAFYRLLIKVKLLSQLSGGDIDTVLNAAASLFGLPAENITLTELFPAKIGIDIKEADLDPETLAMAADIHAMIKRILAAGVGLITTLQSYREFKNEIDVQTALFDRSRTTFNLPDAKRTFTQDLSVKHAIFERSGLKVGLPAAKPQTFSQTHLMSFAVFERSGLTLEPVVAKRQTFGRTCFMSFAVFEYSRITVKPVY